MEGLLVLPLRPGRLGQQERLGHRSGVRHQDPSLPFLTHPGPLDPAMPPSPALKDAERERGPETLELGRGLPGSARCPFWADTHSTPPGAS